MKIETRSTNAAAPARRVGTRRQGADESFQLEQPAAASEPAQMTGLSGVNTVGAVLLAQEDDSSANRHRKSMRRAEDLLDRLDEIRVSLLSGRIAVGKLEGLRQALAGRLETNDSPKLKETLDAIDLRVAVELAKYQS